MAELECKDAKLAGQFAKKCGYKPKTGIKRKWYGNHDDVDRVGTQKTNRGTVISKLVLKAGAKLYPAGGNQKTSKAGHTLSVLDFGNGYIHTDNYTLLYRGVNERERIQELVDGARVFTIIEKVDSGENGELTFEILGLESGMLVTEDTWNSAENSGTALLTVATAEGEEESTGAKLFLDTDSETTLSFIETNEFKTSVIP